MLNNLQKNWYNLWSHGDLEKDMKILKKRESSGNHRTEKYNIWNKEQLSGKTLGK